MIHSHVRSHIVFNVMIQECPCAWLFVEMYRASSTLLQGLRVGYVHVSIYQMAMKYIMFKRTQTQVCKSVYEVVYIVGVFMFSRKAI